MTNASASATLDTYGYDYDKAMMITGITRNAKAVRMDGIFSHQGTKARR